jgi:hypothetical protein
MGLSSSHQFDDHGRRTGYINMKFTATLHLFRRIIRKLKFRGKKFPSPEKQQHRFQHYESTTILSVSIMTWLQRKLCRPQDILYLHAYIFPELMKITFIHI